MWSKSFLTPDASQQTRLAKKFICSLALGFFTLSRWNVKKNEARLLIEVIDACLVVQD
jgi:hypothetical protein